MLTRYELDPVNQGMLAPSKYIHVFVIINNLLYGKYTWEMHLRNTFHIYNHELDPVNQGMLAPGKYIHVIVIVIINNLLYKKYTWKIYLRNVLEKYISEIQPWVRPS